MISQKYHRLVLSFRQRRVSVECDMVARMEDTSVLDSSSDEENGDDLFDGQPDEDLLEQEILPKFSSASCNPFSSWGVSSEVSRALIL